MSLTSLSNPKGSLPLAKSAAIPVHSQNPQTLSLASTSLFSASTQMTPIRVDFSEEEEPKKLFSNMNDKLQYALHKNDYIAVISALKAGADFTTVNTQGENSLNSLIHYLKFTLEESTRKNFVSNFSQAEFKLLKSCIDIIISLQKKASHHKSYLNKKLDLNKSFFSTDLKKIIIDYYYTFPTQEIDSSMLDNAKKLVLRLQTNNSLLKQNVKNCCSLM